jgi:hypothetical protein
MKSDEAMEILRAALLKAKQPHYRCDDSWYSCHKDPDGCSDEEKGKDCTCGADRFNAEIDAVLLATDQPPSTPSHTPRP